MGNHDEPSEPSTAAENLTPPVLPAPEVKADHTIGMLCHLLSLTLLLGVPLGNILGPLTVWLIKRDEDPFVDLCGKESLNFQISMTLYMVIAGIFILLFVGLFMVPILMILNIVYTIIAAIKASQGTSYTYPLTIRFIK
ncbi:MAG: putative Tic20 family protein [Lentimonas sp.]|jgi:uncharacterized Tic20 family protein